MAHRGLLRYKVYFTPISLDDQSEYAEEIDVTEWVLSAGVGSIRRAIDSSDYDIGVFSFEDLELKMANKNGLFSDNDSRSFFPSTRDRCKVRVVFEKEVLTRSGSTVDASSETTSVVFRGLINEEATREDITKDEIRFKVLSRDSVLRTTQISAGVVSSGSLASVAILNILNFPRITSVLTVDAANINPDLDITIDDGTWFDEKKVKDALDSLLFATNSCLLIADDGTVSVQSRDWNEDFVALRLFGPYDEQKRENIINIKSYNPGRHRAFTKVIVNETEVTDTNAASAYGLREKTFELPFITDLDTELEIAQRVVNEFRIPKTELTVDVSTDLIRDVDLLHPVSVNHPLRLEPWPGTFLPVVGVTVLGDDTMPLPKQFGSTKIDSRTGFKIIEISHNPDKFVSTLKLRQFGTDLDDGVFDTPFSSILGFAILGVAPISGVSDPCDTFNPSVLGAARLGCTESG